MKVMLPWGMTAVFLWKLGDVPAGAFVWIQNVVLSLGITLHCSCRVMEQNKSDQECDGRRWGAFFIWVVRVAFIEKMTFEQRLGGEGRSHVALWGKMGEEC